MNKRSWAAWALAAATLLLALLLMLSCLSIYREGIAPENLTEAGVLLQPIYSREQVVQRLGRISWAFWLWAAALAAALFQRPVPSKAKAIPGMYKPASPERSFRPLRLMVFATAVLLIVQGVQNGGMHDVLVKAINICTECIGLG